MPAVKTKFTTETAQKIYAYIRQGAFPHIAAEAAGVTTETFNLWCERGALKRPREPYKTFAKEVRAALAQARLLAELEVRTSDPKFWLRSGPGRDIPGSPGWAREVKPHLAQHNQTINFLSPEWLSLWSKILGALQDFPEARAMLAKAISHEVPLILPPQQ